MGSLSTGRLAASASWEK